MPVTLEQLLAQPDFHLRLRAGAEPGTPALREPLAWAHSSDLPDPTPWLSAGGLLLTDGTQFDSDGETAWADGYVGRLVSAEVAALGFATQVVHAEVPARLVDACRRRGLILVEVAERAPFMAIIAFVNDAAAREQRERLEWSLAAHRAIARAALRPDGLNAVLKELEGQLGCWVALFDAAGYRVPTATRLPVPAAVEREVGEAVRTALSRGTRGSLRISSAGADVTVQTLGRSRELHGVLAVGTQAPLRGAERDLVTSVIALASIALDQTRTIEDARRRLRAGLFELMLSGASEVADSTAMSLWGRLPVPPLRVCVLAAAARLPVVPCCRSSSSSRSAIGAGCSSPSTRNGSSWSSTTRTRRHSARSWAATMPRPACRRRSTGPSCRSAWRRHYEPRNGPPRIETSSSSRSSPPKACSASWRRLVERMWRDASCCR